MLFIQTIKLGQGKVIFMNNNNNGNHKGHQDPKPEHGKDQKGHKGGDKPRIPTNPGTSHAMVK